MENDWEIVEVFRIVHTALNIPSYKCFDLFSVGLKIKTIL